MDKVEQAMQLLDKAIYTFTKKWMNRFMWCFILWISASYVLAFLGKEAIAESLSQTVMSGGVALFSGYMLKAFFETWSAERNKLKARATEVKVVEKKEAIAND